VVENAISQAAFILEHIDWRWPNENAFRRITTEFSALSN